MITFKQEACSAVFDALGNSITFILKNPPINISIADGVVAKSWCLILREGPLLTDGAISGFLTVDRLEEYSRESCGWAVINGGSVIKSTSVDLIVGVTSEVLNRARAAIYNGESPEILLSMHYGPSVQPVSAVPDPDVVWNTSGDWPLVQLHGLNFLVPIQGSEVVMRLDALVDKIDALGVGRIEDKVLKYAGIQVFTFVVILIFLVGSLI